MRSLPLTSAFGTQSWVITKVRLIANEMAAPDNAVFNRGVGAFEVRWLASNAWIEGTGKPSAPTTDGVSWEDLPTILNSNRDKSLGIFTNAGADGPIALNLELAESFVANFRLGGQVSLHLTAASPGVGFTFNSRNFGNTNAQPALEIITAADPRPRIDNVFLGDGNLLISFDAVSNWTYRLQRTDSFQEFPTGIWSDVLTIPAQASTTNIVYRDAATNPARLYRLSLSQ